MKIGVIGTGRVGLVTSAALAGLGHEVSGMDTDPEKIALLRRGEAPFFEPDLDRSLAEGIASGRLRFGDRAEEVVADAELVFLCVGRPPVDGADASLVSIEGAAREVARCACDGLVIVEKSTVPPGTADKIKTTIGRERPALDFEVVANPEFLREGRAMEDSLRPDRILVGAGSERGFETMRRLYEPLIQQGHQLIETDVRTAELAKLAANAFLALKVSFVNALARLCEVSDADVVGVADAIGADPRIGRAFLNAGLGYGGYCLPKDILTLDRTAAALGYEFSLLREVVKANVDALDAVEKKIEAAMWNTEGKHVALLGLAFKSGTDDVRESPALMLARRLLAKGARVVGFDDMAAMEAKTEVPQLEIADDPYAAVRGAHCVVICTEWSGLADLDLGRLRDEMAYPIIVDGPNAIDIPAAVAAGFTVYPTGRPVAHPDAAPERS